MEGEPMSDDRQPGAVFKQPGWDVKGDVKMAGRDYIETTVNNGASLEVIAQLFDGLRGEVATLPDDDRALLEPIVKDAQETTEKIQAGDESPEVQGALEKRLRALVAMAPDIGEVFVATLTNPPAGIALVIRKIAAKVSGQPISAPAE
jgi:hypothetical protein